MDSEYQITRITEYTPPTPGRLRVAAPSKEGLSRGIDHVYTMYPKDPYGTTYGEITEVDGQYVVYMQHWGSE